VGLLLLSTRPISRGDSEIVVAIRYLQAKGTSHSHLYLYREDGKLLRQLTNDNSGQDSDSIFAGDGESIVFTREKEKDVREFWGIDPLGKKLKKLTAAPDWYSRAKDSPAFTRGGDEEAQSSSPTPPQEESASPAAASESPQLGQHQSGTALDAVVDAKDRPPATITAPDGSGEIFWRKGEDKGDPLDWVMWFRDLKSGQETQIGKLPGFPSFEPLQIRGNKDHNRAGGSPATWTGSARAWASRSEPINFCSRVRSVSPFSVATLTARTAPRSRLSISTNESSFDYRQTMQPRFRFPGRRRFSRSPKIAPSTFPAVLRQRIVPISNVGARILRRGVTTRPNFRTTRANIRTAEASQECVMRAKGVPRSATALPCIGPEKLRRSSPSATDWIKTEI
jgi:hypothetical protein